jgi:creatinase
MGIRSGAGALPHVKRIQNGERTRHTFSEGEFAGRHAALRQVMQEERAEAVLFTSIHNVNYYSDFLYRSFGAGGHARAGRERQRQHRRRPAVAPHRRREHRLHRLAAGQFLLGARRGAAGVPARRRVRYLTIESRAKLEALYPGVTLVDVAPACMRRRMVKSAEEIAHISP